MSSSCHHHISYSTTEMSNFASQVVGFVEDNYTKYLILVSYEILCHYDNFCNDTSYE